tara:strand:+ start:412 stop:912 length:501 start_codon:yes stop_codon:yes gene_type:complete
MNLTTKQLKQIIKEELLNLQESEDVMDLDDFNKIMQLLNTEQFDYALELMSYFNLKATEEQWKKALARELWNATWGAADTVEGKKVIGDYHATFAEIEQFDMFDDKKSQAFVIASTAYKKWRKKTKDKTEKLRAFLSAVEYVSIMRTFEEFYGFLEKANWGTWFEN